MSRDSTHGQGQGDIIDRGRTIARATEAHVSTAFKELGQWPEYQFETRQVLLEGRLQRQELSQEGPRRPVWEAWTWPWRQRRLLKDVGQRVASCGLLGQGDISFCALILTECLGPLWTKFLLSLKMNVTENPFMECQGDLSRHCDHQHWGCRRREWGPENQTAVKGSTVLKSTCLRVVPSWVFLSLIFHFMNLTRHNSVLSLWVHVPLFQQ